MIDDVSSITKCRINLDVLQEILLELERCSLSDRREAERWERLLNNIIDASMDFDAQICRYNWDKKLEGLQKIDVKFEPVDRYPISANTPTRERANRMIAPGHSAGSSFAELDAYDQVSQVT